MSASFAASLFAVCQRVGRGARVRGRPTVENLGEITIGHALVLNATPVPTHLVTAPGATLAIGDRVTIGHGVGITAHAGVHIGHDVVVGPFAMILDTDFHVAGDRNAHPECTPIHIGNGVSIGAHVTVLRGSVIGDGASVAPGSVVAGRVPAGARVSGNPARATGVADEAPADTVPAVVARTLGLAAIPAADDACAAIPGWDSLGMLNVLLSLEAAFDVELAPDAIAGVRRVQDLIDVVLGADRPAAGVAR